MPVLESWLFAITIIAATCGGVLALIAALNDFLDDEEEVDINQAHPMTEAERGY